METNYGPINGENDGKTRLSNGARGLFFVLILLVVATLAINVAVLRRVRHQNDNSDSQLQGIEKLLNNLQLLNTPKYAVSMLVPRDFQEFRGTCWDFSTVEFLEHTYRVQGIKKGFLKPNQYTKFSKQAYGATMIQLCANQPVCEVPGDQIAFNSTEGGEVPLLFYFPQLLNMILPESVCPYYPQDGNDTVCPGATEALKHNPLKFSWSSNTYTTLYDINSIKQALINSDHLLPWSSSMFTTNYYAPCPEDSTDPQCQAATCNFCPFNLNYPTACCLQTVVPMYNMDGEFYFHEGMDLEGGHAMALVGYNDLYTTRTGYTGGFIIRNTWHDGQTPMGPRGSHSVRYLLQQISDADERAICPNAFNPWNYYMCDTVADCLSATTANVAAMAYQPVRLNCINSAVCSTSMLYLAKNVTTVEDSMAVMCFFSVYNNGTQGNDFCLPPQIPDTISQIIQPIPTQQYNNSNDECGYYFWPYEVLHKSVGKFGGFFVNDFPIVWDDSSYSFNSAQNTGLNYTWLDNSTRYQTIKTFTGPYPNFPANPPADKANKIAAYRRKFLKN